MSNKITISKEDFLVALDELLDELSESEDEDLENVEKYPRDNAETLEYLDRRGVSL